jgi:hypothetical protein
MPPGKTQAVACKAGKGTKAQKIFEKYRRKGANII